jgi:peptidoglycan/LPS O-acetylase OafA/YrhL
VHDDRRWIVPVLLAAVALAVVVAAVGLASRPSLSVPRPHGADPHAARDVTVFVASLLLGAVLLARAGGRPRYQARTYRLVGVCLLIAPLLLVNVVRAIPPARRPSTPGGGTVASATTSATRTATTATNRAARPFVAPDFQLGHAASIISLVLTLAAVTLLAIVAYRTMRRPGRHVAPRTLEPPPRDADEVLATATAAIALGGDPRGRVIAAYEAMEAALSGEGAPRGAPQAPLEWIAGLAASHPAAVPPARDLAEIFERARLRSTPVTDADAARARTALDRLRATLAVRQP